MITVIHYLLLHFSRLSYAKRQEGATLIEYVLIVGVIAIGIFVGASAGLGDAITGLFGEASNAISNAPEDA